MTPGSLALAGVYLLGMYAVVALVMAVFGASDLTLLMVAVPVLWVAGLLLTVAGIAKVIQIGVRSASDA